MDLAAYRLLLNAINDLGHRDEGCSSLLLAYILRDKRDVCQLNLSLLP